MISVRERIHIDAPVERVFSYLDTPANQATITPSLTESTRLERLPNGGDRARYTYWILGLSFSGEVRATNYVPNERIVWNMTGDLKGTIRWYLEPFNRGCLFTYAATYQSPGPSLLQPLVRPLIQRYNEREVQALLHNLRARIAP